MKTKKPNQSNFSLVNPKLKVGKTKYGKPPHNKGVFAKQDIRKEERVIVFACLPAGRADM